MSERSAKRHAAKRTWNASRDSSAEAGPMLVYPERICKHGHDLSVVGMYRSRGECYACKSERAAKQIKQGTRIHPRTLRKRNEALVLDPCSYCGGTAGTLDHIVPTHRGGDHEWTNLTAACLTCNSAKSTLPLLHYLLARRIDALIAPLAEERGRLG